MALFVGVHHACALLVRLPNGTLEAKTCKMGHVCPVGKVAHCKMGGRDLQIEAIGPHTQGAYSCRTSAATTE